MKLIVVVFVVYNFGFHSCYHNGTTIPTYHEKVKSADFVDKTLMIPRFFDQQYVLLVAPKGFGKTTNTEMLRRFCELVVDENGMKLPLQETQNYKTFTQNNLNVYNDGPFFNAHFGRYPTIFMDFTSLSGVSFQTFLGSFKRLVSKTFTEHKYLSNSKALTQSEKGEFNSFIKMKCNQTQLEMSFQILSKLLRAHFNQSCVVLIDSYDWPVQDAIFNSGVDIEIIVPFIDRVLWYMLDGNPCVWKALINTCLKLFIVPASVKCLLFVDRHPFNLFYGLQDTEVFNVGKKFQVEDKLFRIRGCYGGFLVGKRRFTMYNTYSVVSYFKTKRFFNYWGKKYGLALEKLSMRQGLYEDIVRIIASNLLELDYVRKLTVGHIKELRDIFNRSDTSGELFGDTKTFLNLMTDLGYFSMEEEQFLYYGPIICNREVYGELWQRLHSLPLLKRKFKVTDEEINDYVESINNLGEQNSTYYEYARSAMNLFKRTGWPKSEKDLENPLIFLAWYYQDKFLVVNSEFLYGRYTGNILDFLVIRKDHAGIIIEFDNSNNRTYQVLDRIVWEQVDSPYHAFWNYEKTMVISKLIYVSFHLDSQGNCRLSYTHGYTRDMSRAVTLPIAGTQEFLSQVDNTTYPIRSFSAFLD